MSRPGWSSTAPFSRPSSSRRTIIFLTITLIVIVAALNIIATLILMVMEKTRDIGILIAMGATSASIRRIFFVQGALDRRHRDGPRHGRRTGLVRFGQRFQADPDSRRHLSDLVHPLPHQALDLLLIIGVSLAISLLSTLFPSHRASQTRPGIGLKYE